jgi:tetratricopeptide (TPR) repeat protein
MSELTKDGIREFQSGDREKAARILARALQINPRDADAWYWLSACVDDLEKKRYCLQRVLLIDPEYLKARWRLDRLDKGDAPIAAARPAAKVRFPLSMNRRGVVVLGGVILAVSLGLYAIITQLGMVNKADISVVLNEAGQAPALTVTQTVVVGTGETSPEDVLIPVTGKPVLVSGDGTEESDNFSLPAGKVTISWHYIGQPDEERRLQQVKDQHRSIMQVIEEEYKTCIQEGQAALDLAIRRQDAEAIAHFEQAVEICIQTYEQLINSQKEKYYDELDEVSTSITILINRRSVDDPIPLVDIDGIYYGLTIIEVEEGDDYYLIVKASGPWSVKIE